MEDRSIIVLSAIAYLDVIFCKETALLLARMFFGG